MGQYKNDMTSDEIRNAIQRERRRAFLETSAMQRHGWIQNIGDLTDDDLERMTAAHVDEPPRP